MIGITLLNNLFIYINLFIILLYLFINFKALLFMMRNVRIGYCPIGMTKILSKDQPKSTYLTIEALEDGLTVSFTSEATSGSLYYSLDQQKWDELVGETSVVNNGEKVYFKGNLAPSYDGVGAFTINKQCNVAGNVMSLLYGDECQGKTDLTGMNYVFYRLFMECAIVDASNLLLPATTLSEYCYNEMFLECKLLTKAPKLPAMTAAYDCYFKMFAYCTSLVEAPELPATKLATWCYAQMFEGCTSLTKAPKLPATTLADSCYELLFYNCSSLVEAPELPATVMTEGCYYGLFDGCTSLTKAPKLPAMTLAYGCYEDMFGDCSSLITAPELPATVLVDKCYKDMFYGCTNLNYIKALFTTEPGSTYTGNWVKDVSATGTFIKSKEATWDVIGNDGVPNGWDVLNGKPSYMKVVALEDDLTVSFTNPLEYSFDETTWQSLPANTQTPAINKDQYVAFRANLTPQAESGIGTFSIDKQCDLKGNCMSLLFGDEFGDKKDLTGYDGAFLRLFQEQSNIKSVDPGFLPATTLAMACYQQMFMNCTSLTTVPELPATDLTYGCYGGMFYGCYSLTTAPELPATTLSMSCYEVMFMGCTSLVAAPELPATTLAIQCYSGMFMMCTNLITAPKLPSTTLANSCYGGMFYGCTSLVDAPELPATTLAIECYSGMFSGCTSLTIAPELPATELVRDCYHIMFQGCTNLNYIKALFTTTPGESYTSDWVLKTSSTGTFVKSKDATWEVTGNSGIPTGWTVEVA